MKKPRPSLSSGRLRLALSALLAVAIGATVGWLADKPEPEPVPPRFTASLPQRPAPKVVPEPPRPVPPSAEAPAAPEPQRPALVPPASSPPPREPAPWKRYAVAAPALNGRIPIAIVIDDVGLDQPRSRRAMELPPAVTLSLLPYGSAIDRQAETARANGHELLVHVSMEADSRAVSPGPNALTVDLGPDEIARRLDWALTRFSGYVGFNNHMGSRFTSREAGMRVVLQEARRRGLLFLDSKTAPETVGVRLAGEYGVPFAARDVFLDNDASIDAVRKQLAALETIARRDRGAIAIGHPHDGTLAALEAWIPTLESRGFVLVPVTALVKAPNG
ncbi:MAG: divergent polysaccharide deacetylase family protein [Gemmatimonas sp.]